MASLLVGYGTKKGQTAKIAEFVASELRLLGHEVSVVEAAALPGASELEKFHGVLIGAPVYASHYPKAVRRWLKRSALYLNEKPSAYFSVCLGVLENNPETQRREREIVTDLLEETGWKPAAWSIFAGALQYSKYSWPVRFMIKRIVAKAGGDTDSSRDYEYTNWEEVRRFAREFDSTLQSKQRRSV